MKPTRTRTAENSKCNISIAFAGSTQYGGEHRHLGVFGDVDVARGRRPGVPDVALGPRVVPPCYFVGIT